MLCFYISFQHVKSGMEDRNLEGRGGGGGVDSLDIFTILKPAQTLHSPFIFFFFFIHSAVHMICEHNLWPHVSSPG